MHHEFVEFIPETLSEGVLYVSIEYKTVAHLCACGCKKEVVTPISPTDWELSFNGNSITLKPSIGNWDFPCKSHYFVTRNKIQWAGAFNEQQIAAVKHQDKMYKATYYDQQVKTDADGPQQQKSFLQKLLSFFKSIK